ncbi:Quinone oxidoreductase 2 [Lachnellula arida]|uniref:Quinone oxidoreductase 2 n=1 Tax=Lachnellula arida TaxID=1316785 RepID=A0A8T9B440_9HELO|nr:Quinone oxidoreductase 2 [Lachnellula arida]
MLALTSITGKLGNAVLTAITSHALLPPSQLILCTSSPLSSPHWTTLQAAGARLRPFNFHAPDASTFAGCTKLFLVSSPDIALDFNDAPEGKGREGAHMAVIDAAVEAGVSHVYYTSLAFGARSKAGVMRAHLRTEGYLRGLEGRGRVRVTVIREGLYSESWPLYLGYFYLAGKGEERDEIVVAGDGRVCWTAIKDLGLGTALVLVDGSARWEGKTFYLSGAPEMARSLGEMAGLVGKARGREARVKVVGREEYVEYYVGRGRERSAVEWWSSSYQALEEGECEIRDGTLGELLASRGVTLKPVEETVKEMFGA